MSHAVYLVYSIPNQGVVPCSDMDNFALYSLCYYCSYVLNWQDDSKTADKRAMCSYFSFSSTVPEFKPIPHVARAGISWKMSWI